MGDAPHCGWYGVICDENELVINLYLGGNRLTGTLPPEIGNFVSLQGLYLWGNQLTSLPPEIGNLVNLRVLGLSYNQLLSIPPEIGNLASLQMLEIYYTQLTSLPPEIGNLASLQVLLMVNNQLSGFIPAFLSNLSNLSQLYLDGNPDLTCWETQKARDWALSLGYYNGPTCY